MPRKSTGERLDKVVSTKICDDDFMRLLKYAKIDYNSNMILQPTISHLLRLIIKNWAKDVKDNGAKDVKDKESRTRGPRHFPMTIEYDTEYSVTQKAKGSKQNTTNVN
jgi:hypothetical protein